MAQLIQFKRRAASGIPDTLLAGEPLYNVAENAFYIGTGSAVVRFDAGAFNGVCSTAAATAAKVVACPGIVLLKGVEVTIKFTVDNTVAPASLTLNVGGTGAKAIKYRGANLPSANVLSENRVYKFYYNGTDQWELIGDLDTDTTVGAALATHTGDSTIHITSAERTNWNAAYGWGNHALAGYALSSALTAHANLTTTAHGLGASAFHADSYFALAGHNHSGVYQPLDADLTAIAGLAGTSGFLKKTAANTWSLDTNTYLTGITKAQVEAVLTGAITSHTHNYQAPLTGTGFVKSAAGVISYDTNTYLTTHQTIYGLTIQKNGNTIDTYTPNSASKTINISDVASASTLASHITNVSNPHAVTKAQVDLGNVENTALSTWAGSGNITTLGTIATGTWNGTTIAVGKGGTGKTSIAANSMLYASAANTYSELTTSSFGRGLLNAASGTMVTGLNADQIDGYHAAGLWRTDNAGSSLYDWSAKNITLAGSITGATTITASSTIQATTAKLTNLTDGYLPYHVSDASGLANSPIYTDGANVGIGMANPSLAKFQIEAGEGVVGQYINGGTTTGTDLLKLRANAPTQRLILEGAGGTVQTFLEAGGSIGLFGTVTNHDFRIRTNYVDRMTFDTAGNVAIGTTDPLGYKLYVSGTGHYTSNLSVGGTLGVTGNTTLSGTLILSATTSASQTGIIYKGSNRFIHDFNYGNNGTVTTAGRNTFVGINAGNFTMGSTATESYHASHNTAVGYGALQLNTTGYYNTASGMQALYYNTTGYYNTASGYAALYYNTTGYYNTASGMQALYYNTTGHRNTASGFQAGLFLSDDTTGRTTGNYGTYIGVNTKASADGTSNETVIGYNAIGAGSNTVVLGSSSVTAVYLGSTSKAASLHCNHVNGVNGVFTGTLGVTGASTLSSARITSAIYFGSSGTNYQINNNGSAKLYDTWVYNLSVKHAKPFIDFYFGNGSQVTSRIIEQAAGVLDVIGSVKIPDSKYLQIGDARLTYKIVDGVGFLKLAHSDGSTAMHFVTTGGQTMYSTGVPATGGGGGSGTLVFLNGSSTASETAYIYAPTTAGSSNNILKSNGSGEPSWVNITSLIPWGGSGSSTMVSRSDHNHSGVYAALSHNHTTLTNFESITYIDSNSDPQNMLIRTGTNDDDILLGNADHNLTIRGDNVKIETGVSPVAGFWKSDGSGNLSVDTNTYSLSSHSHSGYALTSHNHTGVYAPITHSHNYLSSVAANMTDVRIGNVNGLGIRFWDQDEYKIFMSQATDASYGGRILGETTSDYNMYFRFGTHGVNRGFVFESSHGVKLASINPDGFRTVLPLIVRSTETSYDNSRFTLGNATLKFLAASDNIEINKGLAFTAGTIKGAVIDNYGVCSTAVSTGAKTVTISGFRLATGVQINVKFSNDNYSYPITLNVSNTGAKTVKAYGDSSEQDFIEQIKAGAVIPFVYDGTYWVIPTTPSMY